MESYIFINLILLASTGLFNVCHGLEVAISVDKPYVKAGENVTVTCEVTGELGGRAILWYKQLSYDTLDGVALGKTKLETQQMGAGVYLQVPYSRIQRYHLSFAGSAPSAVPPRSFFLFHITAAEVMDAGTYMCEPQATEKVAAANLVVYHPVQSVEFDNKTNGQELHIQEHEKVALTCHVNGSYPAPLVTMYVGTEDVTNQFTRTPSTDSTCNDFQDPKNEKCVMGVRHNCVTSNAGWAPHYQYDGKQLICKGGLQDGVDQMAALTLRIDYPPKIECEEVFRFPLHSVKARVECKVVVRPRPANDMVFWIWKHGEQDVKLLLEDTIEDIRGSYEDLSGNNYIVTLEFDQIFEKHFRQYTLSIANDIGQSNKTITVELEKEAPINPGEVKDSAAIPVTSFILTAASSLIFLFFNSLSS